MNQSSEQEGNPSFSRTVQRVRHPLKARRVEVLRVAHISPHFVRVTFGGPELADFVSASFDDHVKFMLPQPGQAELVLPELGPSGPQWSPDAIRPQLRDYTPRRYDSATSELDIEFALHGDGPAAEWALQAKPGQRAGIGGPKGSRVVAMDYDWHLLIGDDTALPAIARRIEELPAGTVVIAVIQLGDAADRRQFTTRTQLTVHWTPPEAEALIDIVQSLSLPTGEGYAWAAGETTTMTSIRKVLVGQHGMDKDHVSAAAYWKLGAIAHHENIVD